MVIATSVNEIKVTAVPEDENSKVVISGNTGLKEGENTITINVVSDSGNTKTYSIHVTKTDDTEITNANLKSLSIKGFNFYPSFKPNIYNYNLIINESISKLEINVETENEQATYEIIGNENLTEGENLIKIIVKAPNDITTKEYKLNAYISSKVVEGIQNNKKEGSILIGILSVAILITTIILLSKK